MERLQYRQGDIFIIEVNEDIPSNAKIEDRDNERIVLAYGEVTGHAHAIHNKGATLYALENNLRLLRTEEDVELVHEEHSTIQLPANKTFQIIRQRIYTPERIVTVAD